MQSFLNKVVSEVLIQNNSFSDLTFVLPNKRSGIFLKKILKKEAHTNAFLPQILSIEEFIKDISGFESLDSINLLFEFYKVYKEHTAKEHLDSFDNFSKWAPVLIQDFNDLDSNLLDAESILSYLSDTKRIEHWKLEAYGESQMIDNYLSFFEKIITYHQSFSGHLIQIKSGYQGLLYKIACENLNSFLSKRKEHKYIFAGFNALNKAEEQIIQSLLEDHLAEIYWDHDNYYKESNNQSQQFFDRYEKTWNYYRSNDFNWKSDLINSPKTIHLHGLPKNISQIKHVGSVLKELNQNGSIEDTAIILGNEKLLPPLLNSIPKEINTANITMGYELQNVPLSSFFHALFKMHLNQAKLNKKGSFYYKDLLSLLNDPLIKGACEVLPEFEEGLNNTINKELFISEENLMELVQDSVYLSNLFSQLFLNWNNSVDILLEKITSTIKTLNQNEDLNPLRREYLFRFYNIFLEISNLNEKFRFIENLKTLYQLFQQILKTEKLSFQGEPLEGLQIMGLLESRVLDFNTLIITSLNEGYLPATGGNNSFIPLDVKLERKIPTFFEKDAIFSYHFFRLLHRAKNIYLIYNNITDDFGSGEPSRFIRQLRISKQLGLLDKVTFKEAVIHPKLNHAPLSLSYINKTDKVIEKLKNRAEKGFSPSALMTFIRNPIDFYKRSVLGIKEFKKTEETIAANTFGTIVHDTLEQLYHPYLDAELKSEFLQKMVLKVEKEVEDQFKKTYSIKAVKSGKNLLAFEIAKQFVLNFIDYEQKQIQKGRKIIVRGLEIGVEMIHHHSGLNLPIKLRGKIDRIDEVDGVLRIIDYKTGKVNTNQLNLKDWDQLCTDEKFSKSFQVLTYAYMYLSSLNLNADRVFIKTGIVSFKNLKQGFMPFNGDVLSQEILEDYKAELDKLLEEIFNLEIPFQEKELPVFNF
ncbi:PD-(D/E)XK nuclease family protein [Lutimonas zeaxanthinifaciens]|uniref:PD-(D/E)XK nuclease family protein n=1 Tax=Lutimonas zeaxanthinifaciens TaxID=3060215 RepID=UPI00265CA574|nr:PD-(D/E)XK nuclease family protein [Lutimonas sp. YSD2104]WKK66186.1 PD-(D/E)XK nuclease family protein [Lutimonas sp. YSD2104]